jgi:hypothetical protein
MMHVYEPRRIYASSGRVYIPVVVDPCGEYEGPGSNIGSSPRIMTPRAPKSELGDQRERWIAG